MVESAKHMNQLFILSQDKRSIALLADEALFIAQSGLDAFITEELADCIGDDCFVGSEVITTFVGFTMALDADKNLQALVYFFDRNFPEVSKADVAVRIGKFLVELFVFG
jgi:hypothetical protein